jgi:hypothetical protein
MFLKLFQSAAVRGFTRRVHTQMCLASLYDQRRIVENEWKKHQANQFEWNDDEDEQRHAFHEEERKKIISNHKNEQLRCEITEKTKRQNDCECNDMCMAKKSETYLIHYEGGVGTIQKK